MKIILHIGQSKTGTSAIQAYLTLNRQKLAKQRVLYPATVRRGVKIDMGNHNSVADSLCGVMKFPYITADNFFSHAFSEADRIQASQMILSAEHFFGGEPRIWDVSSHDEFFDIYKRKAEALARFTQGHRTELLVYLRPQAYWLASAIGQTVRIQGLISDKQIYKNDRQFFEMAKPVLRYNTLLGIWNDALQPDSIQPVPYHKSVLQDGTIIPDFLRRTGLQQMDMPYGGTDIRVNESLTREYLEVKKRFNLYSHSKSSERVAIRCLVQLSREHPGRTDYQLCPDVLRDLRAFSAAENEALERRFGISSDILNEIPDEDGIPLGLSQINAADEAFRRRFRSPSAWLMFYDDLVKSGLRRRAPFLHGILHQLKMSRHRRRHQGVMNPSR